MKALTLEGGGVSRSVNAITLRRAEIAQKAKYGVLRCMHKNRPPRYGTGGPFIPGAAAAAAGIEKTEEVPGIRVYMLYWLVCLVLFGMEESKQYGRFYSVCNGRGR